MSQRTYELVYIVSPETSDEQVTGDARAGAEHRRPMDGTIEKTENWGRRKLAYEIGHHKEGVYVLEVIEGTGELMRELDRRLKVVDQVIRHLIVRVDEEQRVVERTRTSGSRRCGAAASRAVCRPHPEAVGDGRGRQRRSTTTIDSTRWRYSHAIWSKKIAAAAAAASGDKTRGGDKARASGVRLFRRRKVCKFCADKIDDINYKDVKLLAAFVPERAKVLPRRISGTCAKHQRKLRVAIMRAPRARAACRTRPT